VSSARVEPVKANARIANDHADRWALAFIFRPSRPLEGCAV